MSINILARRAYDASATWAVLRNSVDFVEARKHVLGK